MNKRVNITNVIKKNIDIISAFILCGLSMLLFCVISVKLYPRESTLLTGDAMGQYIPAVRSFVRSIWNGQSLSYSWSLFLGMNSTAYYGTYVGGSFTNFIYLLTPWMSPESFFCMTLTLKVAMAGASFTYFGKKVLKINGVIPVIFSIFYAMCGFQLGINVVNIIWMDAMYLLPLVIVFMTEFLNRGKWKGLVISYTYLFLCNFYMGYIVGFFSALYFIMYLIFYKNKVQKTHASYPGVFVNYTLRVFLAVAMAAFVILPLALFLFLKTPADTTQANSSLVQQDVLLLLSRFFFGIEVSNFERLPFLYVGIPTFLLLIVFFIAKGIEKKEKIFWGVLTVIMVLPCMILPLYMFWHGFDNPDSWYHRFSYVLAFLCTTMACKAATMLKDIKKKFLIIVGILEMICSAGILIYGAKKNKHQSSNLLLWNMILILVWLVTLLIVLAVQGRKRKVAQVVVVLFAMCEVVINGCLEDRFFQDKALLQVWYDENVSATQLLLQDSSFYRVSNQNSINYNSDTWMGYMGINDFWSFENYDCKNALGNLGMFSSPRVLQDNGLNPVTQLILGVRYVVHNSGQNDMGLAGASVSRYPNSLGIGFLVDQKLSELSLERDDNLVKREYEPQVKDYSNDFFMAENLPVIESTRTDGMVENVFVNCNQLINCMTGMENNVFVRLPEEKIEIEENGITLGKRGDDYFFLGDFNDEETKRIDFLINDSEQNIYVVFEGNNEISTTDLPWLYDYYSPLNAGTLGVRYSKELDQVGENKLCTVLMAKGTTRNYISFKEAQFYYVDWDAYQAAYDILSQRQLELSEFKNGYLQGKIEVSDSSQILFTSIPYDDGWKVTAKGANVEIIPLLDSAFLGVRFPAAGTYELTFDYNAPGAMAGKIISVVAWLLFIALCFVDRRREVTTTEKLEEKKEVEE